MTDIHQKFTAFLLKKDLRYTNQKKNIVSAIIEQPEHFEIDKFIVTMDKKGNKFSRATVYRTIKQLHEARIIQKVKTSDGRVFYEYNQELDHHDHIICNHCGKIYEIKDRIIEIKVQEECEKLNFVPEYRSIHIYGSCEDCQNENKKEELENLNS